MDEGLLIEPLARASLRRLGGDDLLEARLEVALGHTPFVQPGGDPASHFERALEHLEAAGAARSQRAAKAISSLAKALGDGTYEERSSAVRVQWDCSWPTRLE